MSVGSSTFGTSVTSAPQERRKQRKKLIGKWQRKMSRPGMKKEGSDCTKKIIKRSGKL